MDKMLYIAMSGAKQNMQALAINANNLANAKTTGFKSDLSQARSMQAFGEGQPTRVFAMTERASQNFDSGPLITTGRSLDLAINGEGWFAVQTPVVANLGAQLGVATIGANSNEAYTRQGNLRLTEDGVLETANGEMVLGENGPIILPLPVNKIEISSDGTIMVQPEGAPNTEMEEVARIKLVNPDVRLLEKGNDGLFRRKDGQVELADANTKVSGGTLESSNVNPLSEMTDMIALQRQFEMHLKLMNTAEEIDAASAGLLRAF